MIFLEMYMANTQHWYLADGVFYTFIYLPLYELNKYDLLEK